MEKFKTSQSNGKRYTHGPEVKRGLDSVGEVEV
jgi:hypothetical protein